jgi:hypothetical protein
MEEVTVSVSLGVAFQQRRGKEPWKCGTHWEMIVFVILMIECDFAGDR